MPPRDTRRNGTPPHPPRTVRCTPHPAPRTPHPAPRTPAPHTTPANPDPVRPDPEGSGPYGSVRRQCPEGARRRCRPAQCFQGPVTANVVPGS
ncbi:hypothetical protein H180DRAFT_04419 [Streptomyces sp. WMMB 322]|nr:hypothetical protein H180DRAFT_04419 [Streptomyces sp. WMMB 322]